MVQKIKTIINIFYDELWKTKVDNYIFFIYNKFYEILNYSEDINK